MRILFTMILSILLIPFSISNAQTSTFTIDSPNGKLAAILQTPDNLEKFPLVIISHGFTSLKEDPVVSSVADSLVKNGIAALRFDFDGHGQSDGRFQDMTVPKEIEDLKAVYEYATSIDGVTSISLLGHSQGGVVTSMVAGDLGKKNIKSIVLLAPAAIIREDAIRGNAFGQTCDPFDPPEYVEIVRPHGTFRIGRDYSLTCFDLPIFERSEKYKGDVCLIHGTGDQLVPYTMSLHYDHMYKKSELHLIPRADHNFTNDLPEAVEIATKFLKEKLK